MARSRALPVDSLRRRTDPAELGFRTSAELGDGEAIVGQARAVEAIELGVRMKSRGYNVFVLGPTGSGRNRVVLSSIEEHAHGESVPRDLCYVHNFEEPRHPLVLELPAGEGLKLRAELERLVEELPVAIPALFESPSYRERREAIEHQMEERRQAQVREVSEFAEARGVALVGTPSGFALTGIKDGKPLDREQMEGLDADARRTFEKQVEAVSERLHDVMKKVPALQREERELIQRLDREMIEAAVEALFSRVRRAFSGHAVVEARLDAMARDMVESAPTITRVLGDGGDAESKLLGLLGDGASHYFRRYSVNLLVSHDADGSAPVVLEDQPNSGNLLGKIEHVQQLGAAVTDFTMIKAGALHRANGGYLVLDARRLLQNPLAYEQLKRVLRSGCIRFESLSESLGIGAGSTLDPEPAPFDGKIVLVGERFIYYQLCALDPEFGELFKIAADFEAEVPRDDESSRRYAGLLARVASTEGLLAFEAQAVARLIEQSARLSGDARRLSMVVRPIFDLMREADHYARTADAATVDASHVREAIDATAARHGRVYDRLKEMIAEGTVHVDTHGAVVGQVNALSYMQLGQTSFGLPGRITARARLGRGEFVDVEREANLGGPIHSKGVLILGGFLSGRYLPERPLSLRATLAFEQMYSPVDGDSASLAEVLVLLSAIAEIPLDQRLAVTGSVDQHGNVQAVGGVNEKIEGFFHVCGLRGRRKGQGVIIPAANAEQLMLDEEVLQVARDGKFRVHAVASVDEALEIVMGKRAGARGAAGSYPKGSVNAAVEARLEALVARMRELSGPPGLAAKKKRKAGGRPAAKKKKKARPVSQNRP